MKKITLLLIHFIGIALFAQTPINDEPSGAIAVTVGLDDTQNIVTGTNVNATDSSVTDNTLPTPTCGNYAGGDVWYSTTVNSNGYIAIETNTTSPLLPLISIYSGNPGSLNLIRCQAFASAPTVINNRTVGEILYVRVWDRNNDNFGDFTISAYSEAAPGNDEPATAKNAPITGVGRLSFSSNVGATNSSGNNGIIDPICQNYDGGDTWFEITVPANGSFSYIGTTLFGSDFKNGGIEIYSGNLGSLVLVECKDFTSRSIITGRTANEKLYIRVWGENSNNGENLGEFGITLSITNFVGVTNDEPTTAINIPVGLNFEDQKLLASNIDATDSFSNDNSIPNPTCGDYNGGDVWFTTTVGGSGNLFIEARESFINGTAFELEDIVISVYSGVANALSLVECNQGTFFDKPKISLMGRTPNEILFIRAYDQNNQREGFFDISVYNSITNDEPSSAITLINGTTFEDQVILASNNGATDSSLSNSNLLEPTCGSYGGEDVWFKAPVGSNGTLTIETAAQSEGIDASIAIYSGTENNLVLLGCAPEVFGEATLTISNRMVNEILFVRIWDRGGSDEGSFRISAFTSVPPSNDEPANAINLTVDTPITGTNLNATDSFANDNTIPAPNCANYNGGDVWFIVNTNAEGNISVKINEITQSDVSDTGLAIYSGTPSALTLISCNDNNGNDLSRIDVSGRTANETLFIRAWTNNNNESGNFTISSFIPVIVDNDKPSTATALTKGSIFEDNPLVGTNENATDSFASDNTIPAPNCASYNGGDVWYTVNADIQGQISVEIKESSNSNITDTGMAIYSGSPSSLVLLDCNDDNIGTFSRIDITGQTVGETLYIRVWAYNNDETGEFQISAFSGNGPVLSINENEFATNTISFFPNPVTDKLILNSTGSSISAIEVRNSLGQKLSPEVNLIKKEINLASVPSGLYFITLIYNKNSETIKVIKK